MIKARAVRKEFLNNPKAKPLLVSKKFNVMLTDVYSYRKQVREFLAGKKGVHIDKDGTYTFDMTLADKIAEIKARVETKPKAKLGRPRKVQAVQVQAKKVKTNPEAKKSDILVNAIDNMLNTLVMANRLDYKRAYAVELLTKNKVKEAISVLSE